MAVDVAVEKILRRDRLITLGGMITIIAVAWTYLGVLFAETTSMASALSEMVHPRPWTATEAWLVFVMWTAMMVAMMVPSATPVILLYARTHRRQSSEQHPLAPTAAFFTGYIVVWVAFSLAMTGLQWTLERAMLFSPSMAGTSPLFGGVVLIAAGVYQWLPTKNVCLRHCRSPVEFLSTHWRTGGPGAFRMGLEHGAYCVGCCWALMILLFVGGVMSLLLVAAIALFVLVEKIAPFGRGMGRVGSIVLTAWGAAVLSGGF